MPEVVLVDHQDQVLGRAEKAEVHQGLGQLHRAFSLFLFDSEGRLLVQRRAEGKPLWPGYWANSCCSHPAPDEAVVDAARRRAREELGLEIEGELEAVFSFEYHARFGARGSEHELCHVVLGRLGSASTPKQDPHEVAAYRWLRAEEVDTLIESEREDERAAPWFKMEWKRLRRLYAKRLSALTCPEVGAAA